MYPILFQIGSIKLYSYGLMVALGLWLGLSVTLHFAKRTWPDNQHLEEIFHSLLLYFVVGGIFGGRLFYFLIYPQHFSNAFDFFRIWEGGLVSFGGLAGALIAFIFWHKGHRNLDRKQVLDVLAPGLALGHALGRIGCFLAGCCYGKECKFPWAVTFGDPHSLAPLHVPLEPTQIFSAILLLVLGGVFLMLLQKKIRSGNILHGRIFALYLTLYSIGRFSIEFLRDEKQYWAGFSSGQWMSALLFAVGVFLLRRSQNTLSRPN